MEKVKIQNIKTGVIKEVAKSLAGDFVGTGNFKLVENKKVDNTPKSFVENKESKEK